MTSRWLRKLGRPRPSFRPVLMLCMFSATIRLLLLDQIPLPIDNVLWTGSYPIWLTIGCVAPLVSVLAWRNIHCRNGIQRWRGLLLRLGSDVGAFSWIVAYHITVMVANPVTSSRVPSRYMIIAVMLWLLGAIAADVVALIRVEWRVRRVEW